MPHRKGYDLDISCYIYWTQALFTLLFCIYLDRTLSGSPDRKWYTAFFKHMHGLLNQTVVSATCMQFSETCKSTS